MAYFTRAYFSRNSRWPITSLQEQSKKPHNKRLIDLERSVFSSSLLKTSEKKKKKNATSQASFNKRGDTYLEKKTDNDNVNEYYK